MKNIMKSLFYLFLVLWAAMYLDSCAPAQFSDANVGVEIKTQYAGLEAGSNFQPMSLFLTEPLSPTAAQLFDPSDMCLFLNVNGANIQPTMKPDLLQTCAKPDLAASFPGMGQLSNFIDLGSSLQASAGFDITIGIKSFDLVGIPKASFSDHACPVGPIQFRDALDGSDHPELFVNGTKSTTWGDEGGGDQGGGVAIFAREQKLILAGENSLDLLVTKNAAGRWIGKEYGCKGGGDYPQIQFVKSVVQESDFLATNAYKIAPTVLENFDATKGDRCSIYLQNLAGGAGSDSDGGLITVDDQTCVMSFNPLIVASIAMNFQYRVSIKKPNGQQNGFEFVYIGNNGGLVNSVGVLAVDKVFQVQTAAPTVFKEFFKHGGGFSGSIDASKVDALYVAVKNLGSHAVRIVTGVGLNGPLQHFSGASMPASGSQGADVTIGSQTYPMCYVLREMPALDTGACLIKLAVKHANGRWALENRAGPNPELYGATFGTASAVTLLSSRIDTTIFGGQAVPQLTVSAAKAVIEVKKNTGTIPPTIDSVINDLLNMQDVQNYDSESQVTFKGIVNNASAFFLNTLNTTQKTLLPKLRKHVGWALDLKNSSLSLPLTIKSIEFGFDNFNGGGYDFASSLAAGALLTGADDSLNLSAADNSLGDASLEYNCTTSMKTSFDPAIANAGEKFTSGALSAVVAAGAIFSPLGAGGHSVGGEFAYKCLSATNFSSQGASGYMSVRYNNGLFDTIKKISLKFTP